MKALLLVSLAVLSGCAAVPKELATPERAAPAWALIPCEKLTELQIGTLGELLLKGPKDAAILTECEARRAALASHIREGIKTRTR